MHQQHKQSHEFLHDIQIWLSLDSFNKESTILQSQKYHGMYYLLDPSPVYGEMMVMRSNGE